ncbi:hypothetical protein HNP25_000517 [Arcicella rosea]|uniref:Uncharacterized protein n=1 Tax=Arcicella rosea TaxID=502909 RepID=A0A841ECM7_9BACT|nr:hypothetical protein [Arcicella rosea]
MTETDFYFYNNAQFLIESSNTPTSTNLKVMIHQVLKTKY